eukprot:Nitzschia sp. Nitz4//scaffold178_size73299//13817//14707//NITZ4_005694-RA/size73299-processed-gene-0.25-mRNA-1//-1//CDS//3329539107//6963//frame0
MSSDDSAINRPRNYLVTDATQPYNFVYKQYGKPVSIVVDQSAEEDTWPGGALWDIGVLLAQLLVGLAGFEPIGCSKVPSRLLEAFPSTRDLSVLELGAGVGLTGLVAAAVLGTKLTLLTDLEVVVEKIAAPNMVKNTIPSTNKQPYRLTSAGNRGRVMALPLCWGNQADEAVVAETFAALTRPTKTARKKKGQKQQVTEDPSKPDMIIIGDVAYQHRPGAPSHFDALMSTVLKFLGPQTLVVFGTRMRMPASRDLLEMFATQMEEIVSPPVAANEINPTFGNFKHQITVHVFRKRQ